MNAFAGMEPFWFQGAAWAVASEFFGEKKKRKRDDDKEEEEKAAEREKKRSLRLAKQPAVLPAAIPPELSGTKRNPLPAAIAIAAVSSASPVPAPSASWLAQRGANLDAGFLRFMCSRRCGPKDHGHLKPWTAFSLKDDGGRYAECDECMGGGKKKGKGKNKRH